MAKSKKTETKKVKFQSLNVPYKWVGRLGVQFRPAKEGDRHGVYETANEVEIKNLELMEGIVRM